MIAEKSDEQQTYNLHYLKNSKIPLVSSWNVIYIMEKQLQLSEN